ncbi:MAG: hypothetical protein CM15mP107_4900 [Bacteroidota bacterium]|nr:MAG: hypothetical protein CM15mP107_4900 [Bacteroidota bacterium]
MSLFRFFQLKNINSRCFIHLDLFQQISLQFQLLLECFYSCDPWGKKNFGPNAGGYVILSFQERGSYKLVLSAMVTVNLASVGLDADLSFPFPYNGENPILNTVLGTDYSALKKFPFSLFLLFNVLECY